MKTLNYHPLQPFRCDLDLFDEVLPLRLKDLLLPKLVDEIPLGEAGTCLSFDHNFVFFH